MQQKPTQLAPLLRSTLTVLIACILACSSSNDPPATNPDAGNPGNDAGSGDTGSPPSTSAGAFDIRLVPPLAGNTGFTDVIGRVKTGPEPELTQFEKLMEAGGCVLYKARIPFCSPKCDSSAGCVADNKCQAYPTAISAGEVSITGLRTASGPVTVTMPPESPRFVYQPDASTMLAFPAFSEGADVVLTAKGATAPAFSLTAKGIAPLEVTSMSPINIGRNKAMALRWKAPGSGSTGKIHIDVDISHHGGLKGKIECEVADTGTLDISSAMVTGLIDLGVAGFPTVNVTRRASASTQLPTGVVALNLLSDVVVDLTVEGFQSCNEQMPCPAGKTCGTDLLCK